MVSTKTLVLSRRLAATECILVQWVLMGPHPMGPPFDNGSCAMGWAIAMGWKFSMAIAMAIENYQPIALGHSMGH